MNHNIDDNAEAADEMGKSLKEIELEKKLALLTGEYEKLKTNMVSTFAFLPVSSLLRLSRLLLRHVGPRLG